MDIEDLEYYKFVNNGGDEDEYFANQAYQEIKLPELEQLMLEIETMITKDDFQWS